MRIVLSAGLLAGLLLAAAPVAAEAVSAAKLKLAQELVDTSDANGSMATMAKTVAESMRTLIPNSNDAKAAEVVDRLAKRQSALMADLLADMKLKMVQVYAETLTETELRDAIAWNRSPSGESLRAKLPGLMARTIQLEGPNLRRYVLDIGHAAVDARCEVYGCSSDDRAQMLRKLDAALSGGASAAPLSAPQTTTRSNKE